MCIAGKQQPFGILIRVNGTVATHHGLGRHIWLLPIPTLFDTLKNCILVLYCFAIALTKLAIISQYLRFIPDKSFRAALYAISVIILGLFITGKTHNSSRMFTHAKASTGIFVTIFQCRPVRGAWNFTIEPVCVDYVSYLYASSAVNVATDLLLFVLPLSHLWKLNLPRKQRVILCVLLAGGARYVKGIYGMLSNHADPPQRMHCRHCPHCLSTPVTRLGYHLSFQRQCETLLLHQLNHVHGPFASSIYLPVRTRTSILQRANRTYRGRTGRARERLASCSYTTNSTLAKAPSATTLDGLNYQDMDDPSAHLHWPHSWQDVTLYQDTRIPQGCHLSRRSIGWKSNKLHTRRDTQLGSYKLCQQAIEGGTGRLFS
ncbi:hypothetical protein IG631_09919 [Alternaria alternata]|nr:hypothetical protein IG631_09919 [Alternaria alternata]